MTSRHIPIAFEDANEMLHSLYGSQKTVKAIPDTLQHICQLEDIVGELEDNDETKPLFELWLEKLRVSTKRVRRTSRNAVANVGFRIRWLLNLHRPLLHSISLRLLHQILSQMLKTLILMHCLLHLITFVIWICKPLSL